MGLEIVFKFRGNDDGAVLFKFLLDAGTKIFTVKRLRLCGAGVKGNRPHVLGMGGHTEPGPSSLCV